MFRLTISVLFAEFFVACAQHTGYVSEITSLAKIQCIS